MIKNIFFLFILCAYCNIYSQDVGIKRNLLYDYNFQLLQEILNKRYFLNEKKIYVYDNLDDYYLRPYKGNKQFIDSLKKYFKKSYDYPLLEASCCGTWTKSYDFKENDSVIFIPKRKADDFLFESDSLYKIGKIKQLKDLICLYPVVFEIQNKKSIKIQYAIILSTTIQEDNCDMYKGKKGYVDLYLRKNGRWVFISNLDVW